MSGVTVVVDFGATDTVSVLRRRGEEPRPVAVDGEPSMPSAVLLSPDDHLVVGREAVRLGVANPDRLVSDLKNRLDKHDLMVGDIVLPVTALVRTLLTRVLRAAGPADVLVLTHPADWPEERVDVLTRAANGLAPSVRTVSAPLAAAAGADFEPDEKLLVLDLDGDAGTAALVRRKSGRPTVVSYTDLPPDADLAKLATDADAVLVVGRSARTAALTRRLAELGRPVRAERDPGTAVARGALRLGERPARGLRSIRSSRPTRRSRHAKPVLRSTVVSAAGVVIVAAVAAVLMLGWGPGLRTAGSPGPAAGALVDDPLAEGGENMPPAVEGKEMVAGGQPTFTAGRQGSTASYRTPDGAVLAVSVGALRSEPLVPGLGDAPAGYRWLIVTMSGTNTSGPDWDADYSRSISVLDDRGLWIRPIGDGVVPCSPDASKPPAVLPKGQQFTACVAMPLPEQSPVSAVVFGPPATDEGAQAPIRVPVKVPAVPRGKPASALVVGKLGEPPAEVTLADTKMRAGFDMILTPSGYLDDRSPAAGNRFVVVRAALGPADDVFLRDDRGVLSRPVPGFDRMPECPPFIGPGTPEKPVYACFVYEVDAGAKVTGVTYGDLEPGAPLSGRDMERWPTWTTG